MSQRIGNIGLLNLMEATEESIKGIERIENVGVVLYRKENAHLLSALNIGNIGSSLEVSEGYSYSLYNGSLNLDEAYLTSISEPIHLLVNGAVIIDKNLHPEHLKTELLQLMVNGQIYSPPHLSGLVSQLVSKGSIMIETYDGAPPRFENGKFTLTNSLLAAIDEPLYLIVNGVLSFSKDLNMELFDEKISKLQVNGKISIFENQEPLLYKKMASSITSAMEIIPDGYELLNKPLRLNSRSIRRFHNKKLFTKKPIIFEADITREILSGSIAGIHSSSVIICHEDVEDLIYELTSSLETEVISYEHRFVMIEGEETWSNDQFLALEKPTNFIVSGTLKLESDVKEETLRNQVVTLDVLGEVIVQEKKLKGFLQNLIRINLGSIKVESTQEQKYWSLNNVGELSL